MAQVVADASVLIALAQLDQLPLLERLFKEIRRVEKAALELGEREALALALQLEGGRIILDDLPARNLAATLGLSVIGTAGVLLAAKRSGLITAVRPLLDALRARGFRLRQDVYEDVLRSAGERGTTTPRSGGS